jgi:hypothetical protein
MGASMTHEIGTLDQPRPLTQKEFDLVAWLLRNGNKGAETYLHQLDKANVVAHCKCGCASIDFSIDEKRPTKFEMCVLADYQWRSENDHLFGIFVFEQDGLLAGLDVWSIDGQSDALTLPSSDLLFPYGSHN